MLVLHEKLVCYRRKFMFAVETSLKKNISTLKSVQINHVLVMLAPQLCFINHNGTALFIHKLIRSEKERAYFYYDFALLINFQHWLAKSIRKAQKTHLFNFVEGTLFKFKVCFYF